MPLRQSTKLILDFCQPVRSSKKVVPHVTPNTASKIGNQKPIKGVAMGVQITIRGVTERTEPSIRESRKEVLQQSAKNCGTFAPAKMLLRPV
jgi:hypothetical protein